VVRIAFANILIVVGSERENGQAGELKNEQRNEDNKTFHRGDSPQVLVEAFVRVNQFTQVRGGNQ